MFDSDVLALALAVVKPGGKARLIRADNTADDSGWIEIEDAVSSGQAFMVDLKPTLAAFDLDSDELVKAGYELRMWADLEGLPTLLVSSGRVGHLHLYVRTDDRAAVEGYAVRLGIPKNAIRRTIRPPLAPHRKGLETGLVAPETVENALRSLGPSEHAESTHKNFPEWLLPLIRNGDTEGKYSGRSAMALAIASGIRRSGYGYETFRAVMTDEANAGSAKYFALRNGEGAEDPEAFLVRVWQKSEEQLTPEKVVTEISGVQAKVMAAPWLGRTGNTDRSVMLALCELGTTSATTALAFGSRGIAEVAQVQEKTVRRALGRLVSGGWLVRVKASKLGDADTYRFGPELDKMTALSSSPHINKGTMCGTNDHIEDDRVLMHPVFRNGSGLGRNRGQTWLNLQKMGRPVTAQELADSIGVTRRTVDRNLKGLAEHGLAVKSGTRWEAGGDLPRLDELAIQLGSIDRAIQQIEQHERNRKGFRAAHRLKSDRKATQDPIPEGDSDTDDEWQREEFEQELHREELERELYREVGLPHHG